MSEHQTRLAAGEIQFHQWCQPPLDPGEHNVEITQIVTELVDGDIHGHGSLLHLGDQLPRHELGRRRAGHVDLHRDDALALERDLESRLPGADGRRGRGRERD
jgi:hypothetical protein